MSSPIIYPARRVIDLSAQISVPLGFQATCSVGDSVGDPVIIVGDNEVSKLSINVYSEIVVGVILSKESTTACTVAIGGLLAGITSGLTTSKPVWVSTTGGMTTTKPLTGHQQIIGYSINATDVVVSVATDKHIINN